MTRVACIGECMVELRERGDGLLSRSFGGDTLNTAVYLARLGVAVDYITALGTDPFSDDMLAAWRAEGIGTDHVLRVPGRLPGLYMIQTDAVGERQFSHWRDAAPVRQLFHFPEAERIAAAMTGYDVIYLSGITLSLFDEPDRQQLFDLLDRAREHGGRIVFDTNFRSRGWPDRAAARHAYAAVLARSDVVLASAEDHAQLFETGADAPSDVVFAWLAAPRNGEIVLRSSDLRCFARNVDRTTEVVARRVSPVVDTTAAGDSFAAAYLAARLAGEPIEDAVRKGHRLAALVIQHNGAIVPADAMKPVPPA